MSASDIPETYRSSHAMARALASYIDDPHRVRAIVLESFLSAPDAQKIRRMRQRHLAPKPVETGFRYNEHYYPSEAADTLARTNTLFLLRLEQERTLSLAMRDYRKRVPVLVE